ncbi:flagellar basal body P-ring formation chaperone FlgA [Meridianimarinicoccus sp. RP-17]|uniref:flagellar basal body P-ring formation chaperone FlgA n=1 Tax=Meridianimarinicoccus zhengii TaxID=2056810 RepID=UPI000DAE1C9A|nr:flagellar basal body P-ring formation chaperone FlgA [Phycocomes zhengii]
MDAAPPFRSKRIIRPFLGAALALVTCASGVAAHADTLAAARNLPAHSVLTEGDLVRDDTPVPGALHDPAQAIGRETRVAIYAGRPVFGGDLTSPALVERNQIVPLTYFHAGLAISTDGRALDRGSVGDRIRVMNLASRSTVIGRVGSDGSISVAPN